jgi:hypothetical protein
MVWRQSLKRCPLFGDMRLLDGSPGNCSLARICNSSNLDHIGHSPRPVRNLGASHPGRIGAAGKTLVLVGTPEP